MAKKRLILHIGMHKTGTTSVQRYFSRNRMMLRRMGVIYPKSIGPDGQRQPKHNAIFSAISHEADFGVPHPILGPAEKVIADTGDEIESSNCDLAIISAEGLSGERPVFAAALVPLKDRFDVTVVMFLRRQDHWVESFYKQMVLNRDVRESRDFHSFIKAPATRAHMSYDRIVAWWDRNFGQENVSLIGFHSGYSQSPLIRLMEAADMNAAFRWLPFARARENRSPGADAIEVVRRCNEMGLDAPRDAADLIEAKLGRGQALYMTASERLAFLQSHFSGNQRLLPRMRMDDRACLCPNMAQLGHSNERRWIGELSSQFSSNSMQILGLKR